MVKKIEQIECVDGKIRTKLFYKAATKKQRLDIEEQRKALDKMPDREGWHKMLFPFPKEKAYFCYVSEVKGDTDIPAFRTTKIATCNNIKTIKKEEGGDKID